MANKIIRVSGLLLLIFFISSCEKIVLDPNPSNDKLAVFDEYWTVVNEKYAMFEFKNVDWDMVRDTTRPKINDNMDDAAFFNILDDMASTLRDAHTWVSDGDKYGGWDDLYEGYEQNLNFEILPLYLQDAQAINETGILYKIMDDNIGYMFIQEFDNFEREDVETVIHFLKDTKGLIIDVRGNGGGDPALAAEIASHFTDKEVYTGFERFKSGPGASDFSDSPIRLLPTDGTFYDKAVAILTNRGCYSATTTMIYMMNPLPQVTIIGDRTGGGSGSVAEGYLGNGWIWAMSTSEFIDYENRHLDDGYNPDIFVQLDTLDKTRDEIIERAILELK